MKPELPIEFMQEGENVILRERYCYIGTSIEIRPAEKKGKYSIFAINVKTGQEYRMQTKSMRKLYHAWAFNTCLLKVMKFRFADWFLLPIGIDPQGELPFRIWREKNSYAIDRINHADRNH